ncbi:peptidyl-prolyl cis-trans isomerase [Fopius arisanus]|uniref:peptidylprolyl isomerase n=1 Tax=Fopius arisanus TaxID=64838 RepID=A0A9R1U785_9HYME|nr:PREDICTED: peptidyl-prolyl cis-trans isomerase-like [Fopius arisanus]
MDFSNIPPKIDNKPPKLKLENYYKPRLLKEEAKRVLAIDTENMEILKRIHIINQTKGEVDSRNSNIRDYPVPNRKATRMKLYKENIEMYKKIVEVAATYSFNALMKDWKKNKQLMQKMRRHPSPRKMRRRPSTAMGRKSQMQNVELTLSTIPPSRPRCFFEMEIPRTNEKLGKIILELYDDVVPQTCKNFLSFCVGYNGFTYKNTPFHRIIRGYMCQGGDVTKFNGTGGTSIYGDKFNDENYHLRHNAPGVLSMSHDEKNFNDSKFNLSFRMLTTLDGKNVVFGRVVKGLANIYRIEGQGTRAGKPMETIIISNCGIC